MRNKILLKREGFTLLELLVVISIISLIASILAVDFNYARIKGRDAKRKADLGQIAEALGLFYDQYGGYPAMGATSATVPNGGGGGVANSYNGTWPRLAVPLSPYMSTVPVDPINKGTGCTTIGDGLSDCPTGFDVNSVYIYRSNGTLGGTDATHYVICAWLENQSDPETLQFTDLADPFTPGNLLHATDNYSAYNYCLEQ